ncbi:MAG: ABC transporter permease [Myxococcota bacterium]
MPLAPSPRVYASYARCAFQRRAAYRLANLSGIVVNFFFFLIHAQVFLAFFGGRGTVAGWSADQAVRYFATSEALLMVVGAMSASVGVELADRVRSGDVVVDLARPVRLWARHLSESYGTAAYYLLARSILLYAAAVVLYRLTPPIGPVLLLFPLSLALGVGISALVQYTLAASAYWIENPRGPLRAMMFLSFLFGGIVVPLDFYPEGFRQVCDVLPFRAWIYTPIALATGKLTGMELLFGLAHQIGWFALLAGVAHGVELRGTRRLAALGG